MKHNEIFTMYPVFFYGFSHELPYESED